MPFYYGQLSIFTLEGGFNLARSNFSFKKRQKELARKKKREDKIQRKHAKNKTTQDENPDQAQDGEGTL